MAYDGTDELHAWYKSDPALRKRLLAGWKQFADDLKTYQMPVVTVEPVAHPVEALPALSVQIDGAVRASNLAEYKSSALSFIRAINTDLKTDQDFADADNVVKFCGRTEKELESVKQQALAQTADIDALFRTIDTLKAEMRTKRLELNKLVTAKKQQMRESIVMDARKAWTVHIDRLNSKLESVRLPAVAENFTGVIKGKRTMTSLHDAVNTELARCKIEANELSDHIESNMKALKAMAGDYGFLFSDIQQIVTKERDDLINLAKARIDEYKTEQERQRKEDAAKQAEVTKRAQQAAEQAKATKTEEQQSVAPSLPASNTAEPPSQQAGNRLDMNYVRGQLKHIDANLERYTRNEACRALIRLADDIRGD